jgi:hypothetical protein
MNRALPHLARSHGQGTRATSSRPSITRQLSCSCLELQFPPTTMDYSAHDPDHPGGRDPWASSPQANRTSFSQPPTNDIPSSPLPPQASPYREGGEQYGYMGDQDAQSRPGTAPENGDHLQQPHMAGQDAPRSQQPQQGQQQGQQPQRYHGTRPQRQQQHYKLQAKVTGLERTAKKDPVLRFDVYVSFPTLEEIITNTALDTQDIADMAAWAKVESMCSSDSLLLDCMTTSSAHHPHNCRVLPSIVQC